MLVSQIQPLLGGLSSVSQTSLNSSSAPLPSIDKATVEPPGDPSFVSNYKSPMDVLTTSFILASITSCHERLGNDSDSCSEDIESSAGGSVGHSFLGTEVDISPTLNVLDPVSHGSMKWTDIRPFSWLKQIKALNMWLRAPVIGAFESPPDWASTLSYCIDKSASQSRLIPLQVY